MSNLKISQMTTAASLQAGAVVPIVQSGQNFKALASLFVGATGAAGATGPAGATGAAGPAGSFGNFYNNGPITNVFVGMTQQVPFPDTAFANGISIVTTTIADDTIEFANAGRYLITVQFQIKTVDASARDIAFAWYEGATKLSEYATKINGDPTGSGSYVNLSFSYQTDQLTAGDKLRLIWVNSDADLSLTAFTYAGITSKAVNMFITQLS